jgi:hypothetical protein
MAKIELGMTREQVEAIMGKPSLEMAYPTGLHPSPLALFFSDRPWTRNEIIVDLDKHERKKVVRRYFLRNTSNFQTFLHDAWWEIKSKFTD